jgi:DNA invertase Pin-like site-specific DNA recombinase
MSKITAGYLRLSQDDARAGESNSITNQRAILKKYAEDNGLPPMRDYIDDGYSGTTFRRPGWERLLADVESGEVACILVKDMSRLGRDYLQVGYYTEVVFPAADVRFIAVNDGVDSARKEDNDFTPFRNIMNEWYAKDTSKKLRAVFGARAKAGIHHSTMAPYGYRPGAENKLRWEVDEEAAAVVRDIFKLCLGGRGPMQIADELQRREVLTPSARRGTAHLKTQDPYAWSPRMVAIILSDQEYLGHTVTGVSSTVSYKNHKRVTRSPEDWNIFPDTHEAIIDPDDFAAVQQIREGRRRPTKMGDMGPLNGRLFCADCGERLHITRSQARGEKYQYYVCKLFRRNGTCTAHRVRRDVVERDVLHDLRLMLMEARENSGAFAETLRRAAGEDMRRALRSVQAEGERAAARIAALDGIIEKLYEDRVAKLITEARFSRMLARYEQEQEELVGTVSRAQEETANRRELTDATDRFIRAAQKTSDVPELTAEVVNTFIDRVIVGEPFGDRSNRQYDLRIRYVGDIEAPCCQLPKSA